MTILASVAAGLLVGVLIGRTFEYLRPDGIRDLHKQIVTLFRTCDELRQLLIDVQVAKSGARLAPISEPRLRVVAPRFNTADEGGEQA